MVSIARVPDALDGRGYDDTEVLLHRGLELEPARYRLSIGEVALRLQPAESKLLACLLAGPSQVASYDQLARALRYDGADLSLQRSIQAHFAHLRRKLHRPLEQVLGSLEAIDPNRYLWENLPKSGYALDLGWRGWPRLEQAALAPVAQPPDAALRQVIERVAAQAADLMVEPAPDKPVERVAEAAVERPVALFATGEQPATVVTPSQAAQPEPAAILQVADLPPEATGSSPNGPPSESPASLPAGDLAPPGGSPPPAGMLAAPASLAGAPLCDERSGGSAAAATRAANPGPASQPPAVPPGPASEPATVPPSPAPALAAGPMPTPARAAPALAAAARWRGLRPLSVLRAKTRRAWSRRSLLLSALALLLIACGLAAALLWPSLTSDALPAAGYTVTITAPRPSADAGSFVLFHGTATGLSWRTAMWTVVRADGFIWPQHPAVRTGSRWTGLARIGGSSADRGRTLDVLAVLTDRAAAQTFTAWLQQGDALGSYPPLHALPEGTRIVAATTVQVQ